MNRIPVYFMPGMAASSKIFENISLPIEEFEMFFLEWEIPFQNETLKDYAKRMTSKINHKNPILIGVSFGGILVQEMAEFIEVKKIIIISSVKKNNEFPNRIKIAKSTKVYKLIPIRLILRFVKIAKFNFGNKIIERIKLYEIYLSVRNPYYLEWAFEQIVMWDRKVSNNKIIHIQGDQDQVFPTKNIQNCIIVKGGTHIMILNKYKWINENLPILIKN